MQLACQVSSEMVSSGATETRIYTGTQETILTTDGNEPVIDGERLGG